MKLVSCILRNGAVSSTNLDIAQDVGLQIRIKRPDSPTRYFYDRLWRYQSSIINIVISSDTHWFSGRDHFRRSLVSSKERRRRENGGDWESCSDGYRCCRHGLVSCGRFSRMSRADISLGYKWNSAWTPGGNTLRVSSSSRRGVSARHLNSIWNYLFF